MEQFELRFSIPGSTWLFHTKELGTQRQITIGTGEDCQKRIVSTGNFSINLTRGYEQWTISQADQGTRLYNREPSGKVEEKSVCQLTDGGLISVCCMVNNEMTEMMQIAAEADRTDQINTEYDLRINLGDQNAVTIGAEKCMLSFDRSYVLNQAVTLRKAGDRWMVEQDGKGQATINTTVIIGRAPLQDHDFLTLGGARLYYLEGSLFTSSKIVQSSRGLKTIPVKESAGGAQLSDFYAVHPYPAPGGKQPDYPAAAHQSSPTGRGQPDSPAAAFGDDAVFHDSHAGRTGRKRSDHGPVYGRIHGFLHPGDNSDAEGSEKEI